MLNLLVLVAVGWVTGMASCYKTRSPTITEK